MKTKKLIYFGHIISLVFLFLLFKNLNHYDLSKTFKNINLSFFLLAIGVNIFGYSVHAFRWRIFFKENHFKFSLYLKPVLIGQLMNTILPSKAGELIRPYYFSKLSSIKYVKILSTCIVERVFDGVTTLSAFFLAIIFFQYKTNFDDFNLTLWASLVFYLSCLMIPLLLLKQRSFFQQLISRLPLNLSTFINTFFIEFLDGIELIKSKKKILFVGIMTIIYWIIGLITVLLLLKSSPLPESVQTLKVSILIMGALGLVLTLPSAPANIGVYNFTIYLILEIILTSQGILINQEIKNQLITSSIILHIGAIIPDILCGGITYLTMKDSPLKKSFHQHS